MSARFAFQALRALPVVPAIAYVDIPEKMRFQRAAQARSPLPFWRAPAFCQESSNKDKPLIRPVVAVVGDVFIDVVAKVPTLPVWDTDVESESVKVLPGGSALNGARHLHALGADVRFLGGIGGDAFGKMLVSHVSEQGFSTQYLKTFKDLPSSVCLVLTGPKDRAMVSCYSTTEALSTDDLEEHVGALDGCQHLHIGGYYNMKGLQDQSFTHFVKKCRAKGMTVSMNTQYDASEAWIGSNGHLSELLPLVDLLFVNGIEAAGITAALAGRPTSTEIDNIGAFCEKFPSLLLVVTRGSAGCDVVCAGEQLLQVPAVPCAQIVDATGAGDAFFAGFLSAWLTKPERTPSNLKRACLKGHSVAAVCVGREGACDHPVSNADLIERL